MIYPECKNYHTLNIDVQDFKMYFTVNTSISLNMKQY